ncbi:MAG: outer membrane protein assembly factor BamA [Spirochaetota bacterium]
MRAVCILASAAVLALYAGQSDFASLKDAPLPAAYQGLVIYDILVKGNVNQDIGRIRGLMASAPGRKLVLSEINEDLKTLFSTGLFDNISIDAANVGGKVLLTVIVDERPVVRRIEYIGNEKKTIEQLNDTVEPYLKPGEVFSRRRLDDAADAITSLYRDDGFLAAFVRSEMNADEANESVDVVFRVEEGKDIRVRQVRFHGNREIAEGDLKSVMDTKEDVFFGIINEGKFKQAAFELDKEKIVTFYKIRGFYKARIRNVKIDYRWRNPQEKTAKDMFIDIDVAEGEKYFFGDISVKGNKLLTTQSIYDDFKAKKSDVYNYEIAATDQQMLMMKYRERGYIFSIVRPVTDVDDEKHIVNIMYDIYEGDKAHIENIVVKGNAKTKEHVIRRFIEVKEGEIFNALKIQTSREKIFNTQFFKDVKLDARPGTTEGLMNLVFDVEEGQTGMLSGGGSYGTASGLGLNFEIREINFFGSGQTLSTKLDISQYTKRIAVSFIEPYVFNLPFYFGSELSYNDYETQVTDVTNFGDGKYPKYGTRSIDLGLTLGFYFWDYFRALFSVRPSFFSYYQMVGEPMYAATNGPQYVPVFYRMSNEMKRYLYGGGTNYSVSTIGWESPMLFNVTLTLNLTRDSRNNIINPTRGWSAGINADMIFGDTMLSKVVMNGSLVVPVNIGSFSSALVFFGEYGTLLDSPFSGSMSNMENYLFYINLLEDVRGWDAGSYVNFKSYHALPIYTYASSGQQYALGKSRLRLSMEYRVPVVPNMLGAVAFLDAGQTWYSAGPYHPEFYFGDFDNSLLNAKHYIYSTGIGLRVLMPMLPIRLYLAKRFVMTSIGPRDFAGETGESFFGKVGSFLNWPFLGKGWEFVLSMSQTF